MSQWLTGSWEQLLLWEIVGSSKSAVFFLLLVEFGTLNTQWTGKFPLYPIVAFIYQYAAAISRYRTLK
jgi:hypothetical protein